ncbi:acetyl-CoA carboxylase carboxyltransferase subunit alpha [Clostridium akagii]|uniref:acetyl-CoA carboxylase carboxyltransferase subunit alpha n=1 Tax=Clostridium akagii TaxID=91623 RepID=UPI00047BD90A
MDIEESKDLSAWERLNIARRIDRPTTLDYIKNIFDSFIELHGDREFGDDPSVVGGIAKIQGIPVTVIGIQKGRNTKENIKRNFGMPNPEGYRKSLRLMKQAEKFKRPVICFIDTPGAYCGIGAEERGQGSAIAENIMGMSALKTPIISIVIGEGGSGGALALAVADQVWMLKNAIYSVLSPEGFASILWRDGKRAEEAANVMKITADDLFGYGIIDKIIDEPEEGAHTDLNHMCKNIKDALLEVMPGLMVKDMEILLQERYDKFREIGRFEE